MGSAIPTISDDGFEIRAVLEQNEAGIPTGRKTGQLLITRKYLDPHTLMIEPICCLINPTGVSGISEDDINAAKAAILEVIKGEQSGIFIHEDLPGYKFGLVNDNRDGFDRIMDRLTDADAEPTGGRE